VFVRLGPNRERLRTRAGEDTSVAFGFLKALLTLLEHAPTHFCVAFDPPSAQPRCTRSTRSTCTLCS
jgi:5'-3' exonuclease